MRAHACLGTAASLVRGIGLLLLAAATDAQPLWAQEPEPTARIARLIRQLGSESYAGRQQADDELARLGAATREQIEQAVESSDAEVRLRARDLLRRIQINDLWQASQVRCPSGQMPLAEALALLSQQSGNRILFGDRFEPLDEATVHLEGTTADFWQVLDAICHQSGNHFRRHYDVNQPALVAVGGKIGANPVGYAGPLRVEVVSACRIFQEDLTYKTLESREKHTFQLNLEVMWEDRFRLLAYRTEPRVVAAVADSGEELRARENVRGWNVAGNGLRHIAVELKLHPPSRHSETLDMVLGWEFIAGGEMTSLEVTDLGSRAAWRQDDVELVLTSCDLSDESTCHLSLVVLRDPLPIDTQSLVLPEYSFELQDGDGTTWQLSDQVHEGTAGSADIKLHFRRKAAASGTARPQRLRLTYPRLRSTREMAVALRGIPLPCRRPD